MDFLKKQQSSLQIIQNKGTTVLVAENEDEEELLANEIAKTIISKANRLSKTHNISISEKETRNTITLKQCCEKFLDTKSETTSDKVMMKYRQAVEYLYIYFTPQYKVANIDIPKAKEFRSFLLKVPARWKDKHDLKDKNLKTLIETSVEETKSGKIKKPATELLEKYPKQKIRTIDEVIVKVKTIFADFEEDRHIAKSPFNKLKKLSTGEVTDEREFDKQELSLIFNHLDSRKDYETYNLIKFYLMTGLRRTEAALLKVSHYNEETGYIDLNISGKTEYAKRIIVIHKDLDETVQKQMKDKSPDDYLFFNEEKFTKNTRSEKIGEHINNIIKTVVGEEEKKYLDIKSFRRNFSQELYLSHQFDELEYKTMIGHSTNNDVTDKHYIRGKRDYKELLNKLNKIDFNKFFPQKSIIQDEDFIL